MTNDNNSVDLILNGSNYSLAVSEVSHPSFGKFKRYTAKEITSSNLIKPKKVQVDRFDLGILDSSGKSRLITSMPQSLSPKSKNALLEAISRIHTKQRVKDRGVLDYESSTHKINDIIYTVRGYAKCSSELGQNERYIIEYTPGTGTTKTVSVERVEPFSGQVITTISDVSFDMNIEGVPTKIPSGPSYVILVGLLEAIEEHKQGYGRGGRNDPQNYFLGKEFHQIAGRVYRISAPRMTLEKSGIFKKVYCAETLTDPSDQHLITLTLKKDKKGIEKLWDGEKTEDERRDLEMIIKPHVF